MPTSVILIFTAVAIRQAVRRLKWVNRTETLTSGQGTNGKSVKSFSEILKTSIRTRWITMNTAERIYEVVKNMPETQAAEVLEFIEFVQLNGVTPPERISAEQARTLRAELRALVASQSPANGERRRVCPSTARWGALLMV
ncbi:hypothetical protein [Thiorhodococcus drewsii]|nr:hypothetical protein [Thiorhodococcus drewsii]